MISSKLKMRVSLVLDNYITYKRHIVCAHVVWIVVKSQWEITGDKGHFFTFFWDFNLRWKLVHGRVTMAQTGHQFGYHGIPFDGTSPKQPNIFDYLFHWKHNGGEFRQIFFAVYRWFKKEFSICHCSYFVLVFVYAQQGSPTHPTNAYHWRPLFSFRRAFQSVFKQPVQAWCMDDPSAPARCSDNMPIAQTTGAQITKIIVRGIGK